MPHSVVALFIHDTIELLKIVGVVAVIVAVAILCGWAKYEAQKSVIREAIREAAAEVRP